MTTKFICTEPGCPNENVEYNLEGELTRAECGGCHANLRPVAE